MPHAQCQRPGSPPIDSRLRPLSILGIDWVLLILYKMALDYHYLAASSKIFDYLGVRGDLQFEKYAIGWIITLALYVPVILMRRPMMQFAYHLFFIFSTAPSISLFGLSNQNSSYMAVVVFYWAIVATLFVLFSRLRNVPPRSPLLANFQGGEYFAMTAGLIATIYLYLSLGPENTADIMHSYDVRTDFYDRAAWYQVYIMNWTGIVFLPVAFAKFADRRKWLPCLIIVGDSIVLFSVSGQKAWLFLCPVILFIILASRLFGMATLRLFTAGSTALLAFTAFGPFRTVTFVSIVDRTYLVLSEVAYYYLDFFQNGEFLLLSETALGNFVNSPYSTSVSGLIADQYMEGAYYRNATSGLIPDAYGNFGLLGIIVYPILIVALVRLLDHLTNYMSVGVAMSVIFVVIYQAQNMPFSTLLVSGGVILLLTWLAVGYNRFKTAACVTAPTEEALASA